MGSDTSHALPPLRIRDLTLEWGRRTYVMGIINITLIPSRAMRSHSERRR